MGIAGLLAPRSIGIAGLLAERSAASAGLDARTLGSITGGIDEEPTPEGGAD